MDTNNTDNLNSDQKIKDLEERIAELENNWKRALADYKNFEKRTLEEKYDMAAWACSSLIMKLLPVLDNLEMVDSHVNDAGLKLTLKEFKQILTDEGIAEEDVQGKDFNAETMDAIDMIETTDDQKNKVLEVISKGYRLKDKLIRPARVKVGK